MPKINTRKRGSTWEYRFEAAKIDGKRKHISKGGFKTKKEALEAGAKALTEYNNTGNYFAPNEISINDYMDYWIDTYVKINFRYNTLESYKTIVNNHIKPALGIYKLKGLTASILQEFANSLKTKGLSKSYTKGILTTFSSALDYAVEPLHYIQSNPMHYVKPPKIEKPARKRIILSSEDWKRIIQRFPEGNRFHIMLMIGYFTGLRISEVCGLTWDDIDLKNNTLCVNKIVVNKTPEGAKKSEWYYGPPKTKASARTISFGHTLHNFLIQEYKRQSQNELIYGEYYMIHVLNEETDEKGEKTQRIISVQKGIRSQLPRTKLICIDENGSFTSPVSFKYASRIIHKSLNIEFDFHSLRHTHATILIENGAKEKAVQERLGHEKIDTTLGTYVHNTPSMEKEAVDIFENSVHRNCPPAI